MRRSTHSISTLEISKAAWNEIAKKLDEAGYNCFIKTGNQIVIDMSGIGLIPHIETEKIETKDEDPCIRINHCKICDKLTMPDNNGEFICIYCGSDGDLAERDKNYLVTETEVKF